MPIKAIITGATGMVGEAVLLECLDNPAVAEVLVINRKPAGRAHPKLREIVHADFFDAAPLADAVAGYDACFFCLGVSSVGMDADEYRRMTYDLTLGFAGVLAKANPDMTFCYITGKGTDSSEQGRLAWARVKGATENALMRLFPNAYMFRPGMLRATPGQKNLPALYRYSRLDLSDRPCALSGGLLHLAGAGARDDQRGEQGISEAGARGGGYREAGEGMRRHHAEIRRCAYRAETALRQAGGGREREADAAIGSPE